MNNFFEKELMNIEHELLNLKTSNAYTSVRSAAYDQSWNVSTGVYRINYDNNGEEILTKGYIGTPGNEWGPLDLCTPSGNSQLIQVSTVNFDGTTQIVPITLISNWPIISVTKIS